MKQKRFKEENRSSQKHSLLFMPLFGGGMEIIMEKHVLPIEIPIMTHKPPIAYLLSILMTNKNTYGWIMSHYINFYIREDGYDDFFDREKFYRGCPWIDYGSVSRDLIRHFKIDIIEFCIINLELGRYIYIDLNVKYIDFYKIGIDYDHNALIYGADRELGMFHLVDFTKNGKYTNFTCTFDELRHGFQDNYIDMLDFHSHVISLTIKPISYEFSKQEFMDKIQDHLDGTNLFVKYDLHPYNLGEVKKEDGNYLYYSKSDLKEKFYFGSEFYKKLVYLIEEKEYGDLRTFSLLCDKAIMMQKRLDYLFELGFLKNYKKNIKINDEILVFAKNTLSMFIKYTITKKLRLRDDIVKNILALWEKEEELYRLLIDSIV